MRILVIEDEHIIANGIKKNLEEHGFAVDIALTGHDGVYQAEANEYDLILLDINLPDMLGYEICQILRENEQNTPIIMVTARTEVEDRIQGFDLGADDYLIKPFDFAELRARIRALLRRVAGKANAVLSVETITLNPSLYQAYVNERELSLTMKEYEILYFLMLKNPEPQSLEAIIEHVWDDEVNPFSNAARVHIMNLRRKLQTLDANLQINVKKERGYYLCSKSQ